MEHSKLSNTYKARPCPFIQILSQFYPDFIQIFLENIFESLVETRLGKKIW